MTKPNKMGCRVDEDVCIIHDQPLICKHGCECVVPHVCKEYIFWLEEIKEKAWKYDQSSK